MKCKKVVYSVLAFAMTAGLIMPASAKSLAIITTVPATTVVETKEKNTEILPLVKGGKISVQKEKTPSTGKILPLQKGAAKYTVKAETKKTPAAKPAVKEEAAPVKTGPLIPLKKGNHKTESQEWEISIRKEGEAPVITKGKAEPKEEIVAKTEDKKLSTIKETPWPSTFGPLVRVFLGSYDSTVHIAPSEAVSIKGEKNSLRLKGEERATIVRKGSQITINGKKMGSSVRISPLHKEGAYSCVVNNNAYRGDIILRVSDDHSRIQVINAVPMEQYLYGVVPAEAVSSWPMAALEAQAVAARTYALHALQRPKTSYYDVENDTRSQVYNGQKAELDRTTTAVNNTRGQVILYKGAPIDALFHADAGGHTDNSEDVWGNPVPYLRAVKETPRSVQSSFVWQVKVEKSKLEHLLSAAGKSVGTIKEISLSPLSQLPVKTSDRFASGRVREFTISGTKGNRTFTGDQIKKILGLKSMAFEFGTAPFTLAPLEKVKPTVEKEEKKATAKQQKSSKKKEEKKILPLEKGDDVYSITIRKVGEDEEKDKAIEKEKKVEKQSKKEKAVKKNSYDKAPYIYIRGYGYGHGLGLSQWGAADMAREEKGKDKDFYKKILMHYYQGVTIERRY